MPEDMDLPIALRRTRRSSTALRQEASNLTHDSEQDGSSLPSCLSTPARKPKSKKRVRFSDPGPVQDRVDHPSSASTGLTPMIRRTTLTPTSKKQTRRRHSTPAKPSAGNGLSQVDPFDTAAEAPFSGEITFLPLRQVLDGRVKRRIRRNGLSEEMNAVHAEKRRRAREAKAEIEALRAEVAAKDAEIQRLHDETVVQDTDRILELEERIQELRRELAVKSGLRIHSGGDADGTTAFDWTLAARDPFSDDFMDLDANNDGDDEDDFGEVTMADLACSTPTRRVSARTSFPTPPSTSPCPVPLTPRSHPPTPTSHAGVQVSMPDIEKQQLEEELASLRLEIAKLTTTLESYTSLTSRISDKLAPFGDDTTSQQTSEQPSPDIEAHLTTLLQSLSDRSAALFELNSSLSALGFPGGDASEIVTSLSAAFRTARLELEYLTPGEISLPLTSAGAAVLDLLLTRLRDLSRRCREGDDAVDEYHALELSLRQQLGARVDAMDEMARDIARLEGESKEKDARAADLEVGLQRLKGAAASYARDVAELEALVQRVEAELAGARAERDEARAGHEADMGEWEGILAEKEGGIAALEARLTEAEARSAGLADQLAAMQAGQDELRDRHKDELAALNRSHGAALALRDARVAELRGEVDRVNGALRDAHETVRQLRVEKGGLEGKLDEEKRRAKAAIEGVRAELERVVRMSQELLASPEKKDGAPPTRSGRRSRSGSVEGRGVEGMPATVVVAPGAFLSGDLARRKSDGAGKKRRRYDSGLGFLDEDEVDVL
ncbi:Myosin heavy chain, skeletal muscle, adult [Pleurostoma richardsiae]|uniref:Myosin heavy chain, skeletal muscle, adult n=1 Tax=Pleurostoma richardsiae TaxID=41990 RepID=A0AA38RE11_9PEZI|nr:Myosin heavy chain, skeletal muscle, adult [Pleurostoma richardsiae]